MLQKITAKSTHQGDRTMLLCGVAKPHPASTHFTENNAGRVKRKTQSSAVRYTPCFVDLGWHQRQAEGASNARCHQRLRSAAACDQTASTKLLELNKKDGEVCHCTLAHTSFETPGWAPCFSKYAIVSGLSARAAAISTVSLPMQWPATQLTRGRSG
jgi:hypothetical protein